MRSLLSFATALVTILAIVKAVNLNEAQNPLTEGLPLSQAQGGPSFAQYPVCDVAFESTICFFNQQQVVLPDARPYGLIGRYTFDMIQPLDSSGNKNHALGQTVPGSPWGSTGASAVFRKNFILIPHSTSFESTDYSVSFWIYRLQDEKAKTDASASAPLERWCPIIHKGNQGKNALDASPAILVDPNTGRVKVIASTTETQATQGEFFISNFKLKPHSWNHVVVARHLSRLRLYINGLLDSTMKTIGTSKTNAMPIYVGGAPWSQELCDVPFMLDELKFYSIPIGRDQIQAEAAGALLGMEPSSLFLSCPDCTRLQAEEGCPEGFHLCTKLELIMGGYQVVKQMGLLETTTSAFIFSGENSAEAMQLEGGATKKEEPTTGVGLCCRDSV